MIFVDNVKLLFSFKGTVAWIATISYYLNAVTTHRCKLNKID